MGILSTIIGCIIGYIVSKKFTAKNWAIKLCYSVLCPIVFDILVILIFLFFTGSGYLAGSHASPFIIGSIAYLVFVLFDMRIVK